MLSNRYNSACPKLSCLCLAVPVQLHSSAMIHQEPQLDEKTGANFSEAWPSLLQYVSGKNCGLWLRRITDNSWVLMQVFEFLYGILKTQYRLKSSVLLESWDNNISTGAAVWCNTWKRPNTGRLPSAVLQTRTSQEPLSSHNRKKYIFHVFPTKCFYLTWSPFSRNTDDKLKKASKRIRQTQC